MTMFPLAAPLRFAATTAVLTLLFVSAAAAEVVQKGNLRVFVSGSIAPRVLPRHTRVPVAMSIASKIKTLDGSPPPQLRTLRISINRQGQRFDRGLPSCPPQRLRGSGPDAARRLCRGALIGHGYVDVLVVLPDQLPFSVHGSLLAFKGNAGGRSGIITHIYVPVPPFAMLMPIAVRPLRSATFGTALTVQLPKSARRWARLIGFSLTLRRTYRYRGRRRSYISAACAAPEGFTGAVFPLARTSFDFLSGKRVTSTLTRSCRVA